MKDYIVLDYCSTRVGSDAAAGFTGAVVYDSTLALDKLSGCQFSFSRLMKSLVHIQTAPCRMNVTTADAHSKQSRASNLLLCSALTIFISVLRRPSAFPAMPSYHFFKS
jgi:hypothetical protein